MTDDELRGLIADAIIAATYPPNEWPDGPPGEGEMESAHEEADSVLAAIGPEIKRLRDLEMWGNEEHNKRLGEIERLREEIDHLASDARLVAAEAEVKRLRERWESSQGHAGELIDRAERAEAKLNMPCGSCHPCTNYADETWREAGRKPPHVFQWDELKAAEKRIWELHAPFVCGCGEDHGIGCKECRNGEYPCSTIKALSGGDST